MDRPPENALLTDDAVSLAPNLGDRVVLAGEAANEKVVVREVIPSLRVHPLHDDIDVLVVDRVGAEVRLVAVGGVLSLGGGFPLVGPNRLPTVGLKTESES